MVRPIEPMKAVTGALPASDEGWGYEIKWDGMRLVAYINDPPGSLRLTTTRGNDAVARFPELTGLPAGLEPHQVVLDGEVVAFMDGRPSFGRLQHRMHLSRPAEIARVAPTIPVCYVVFDLLHLDGDDLTQLPYTERRRLLAEVIEPGDGWLMPAHHVGGGADLLEAARTQQLEGIMAKRLDSPYLPGRRSPAWVKIKIRPRQEFVIGGWQPGTGHRSGQLGSLLVGTYQNGALCYAGRVGTGFTDNELRRLGQLLAHLATEAPPFDPPPPRPVARVARWVHPELVAEVTYGEWPRDGILRHPSYIATRNDKDPRQVTRET